MSKTTKLTLLTADMEVASRMGNAMLRASLTTVSKLNALRPGLGDAAAK